MKKVCFHFLFYFQDQDKKIDDGRLGTGKAGDADNIVSFSLCTAPELYGCLAARPGHGAGPGMEAWGGHIDWSAYIINTLRSQEMAQAGIELLPVWVSVTCYVYACQLYKIINYFPFVVCVYSACDNSFHVNFRTLLSQLSSILNFFFFFKI